RGGPAPGRTELRPRPALSLPWSADGTRGSAGGRVPLSSPSRHRPVLAGSGEPPRQGGQRRAAAGRAVVQGGVGTRPGARAASRRGPAIVVSESGLARPGAIVASAALPARRPGSGAV